MHCDLLVRQGTVVTVDGQRRILESSDIAVKDGLITAIDTDLPDGSADRVINAEGRIVIPGLVNSHSHCLHILMRGGPSDLSMFWDVTDWTLNALDPSMRAHERDDMRLAAQLYAVEAIRSGVTTTAENLDYSFLDTAFEESLSVYDELGIRVVLGDVFCDTVPEHLDRAWDVFQHRFPQVLHHRPPFPVQDTDAALDRIERRIKDHNGSAEGRIIVCPAPIDPVLNSIVGLKRAKELAQDYSVPLLIHSSVGDGFDDMPGMTNIQYLDSIGFLGPEVLASHMVDVSANDISLLKQHDVKIGYCPASMMACGGAVAPVLEYLNAGLTVGIGSDDPNANQSVNLISEMKFVALAQNQRYGSNAVAPETVVEMATIGGARALGLEDQIGSIEVGKRADVVVVDPHHAHMTPMHNIASTLVYQAHGGEVETVIIDGQVLMAEGTLEILSEDEQLLLGKAQNASHRLLDRAGMAKLRDRAWTLHP